MSKSTNKYGCVEQGIISMIFNLLRRVEKEVPDIGEFEMVYETIDNPNPNWHLSHIRLAVHKPLDSIDGNESRYVQVDVFNKPDNPYMCSKLIFMGNKQEVLHYLEDSSLAQKIWDMLPQLESDLNDI